MNQKEMKETLQNGLVKMYIAATEEQIAQTEELLGPKFEDTKLFIQVPENATRVKKHLNGTLAEGEEEMFKVIFANSEEARLITEKLHAKVLELRNKLFPESLS